MDRANIQKTWSKTLKLLLGKNTQNQKTWKTAKKSFFQKSLVDNFTNEQKHCVFQKPRIYFSGSVLLVAAGYSLSPAI